MKKIGIVVNRDKDLNLEYTKKLVESINKRSGQIFTASDIAQELGLNIEPMKENAVFDNSEIIICIGGDGTLLRAARKAYINNTPIIGVNLGNLGFLTEIDKNDIDCAVQKLFNNQYGIEERMMLDTVIKTEDGSVIASDFALNDIVVSRVALSRILHLKIYVNDAYVDSFPGDGLIVSSPTGSTAYSMSAGGPVVDSDMDLMVVTPICAHILYSRSFIINGNSKVRIVVEDNFENNAVVAADGQKGYRLSGGYTIEICKSKYNTKLITMTKRNFFDVLRTKIYDRGVNLRKNEV